MYKRQLDEALALPTREAAMLALRTQQLIAHESGVANTVDPFGGSYFVERLTQDLEDGARDYFSRIDELGGMVQAIEQGFPQREIAESAYQFQQAVETGDKTIVGVNQYTDELDTPVKTLSIHGDVEIQQVERLQQLRETRNTQAVTRALDKLRAAAGGTDNLMPLLVEAVQVYATVGEMCDALREVWGEYEETPML